MLRMAMQNQKNETLELAIAMRMAVNAQKEDWKRYVKSLQEKIAPARSEQKAISKQQAKSLNRLLSGKRR